MPKRNSDIASSWNTLEKKQRVNRGLNVNRAPTRVKPSHVQLLNLVGHSVPNRERFIEFALGLQVPTPSGGIGCKTYPNRPPPSLEGFGKEYAFPIGKTPAWVIASSLVHTSKAKLRVVCKNDLILASCGAFLIEGVLNPLCEQNVKDGHHARHEYNVPSDNKNAPYQPRRQFVTMHNKLDLPMRKGSTTTFILYVPQGGLFYSFFAKNDYYKQRLSPLPATYLRLCRNNLRDGGDILSKGGFLSEIKSVYAIQTPIEYAIPTWKCFNVPDEETTCVPDCWLDKYGKEDECKNKKWVPGSSDSRRHRSKKDIRDEWVKRLKHSSTTKALCKQTVRGCVFKNLNRCENMYFVDAGSLDSRGEAFRVIDQRLNKDNQLVVVDQSSILVHKLQHHQAFDSFAEVAADMQPKVDGLHPSRSVRKDDGMAGKMFPIGLYDYKENRQRMFSSTKELDVTILRRFMENYRTLLKDVSPNLLTSLQHQAAHFGVEPTEEMGGDKGITHSMVVSVDLANPPHKDVLDLGPSASIWMEKDEGKAENWYFVFPNLHLKRNGKTYNGMAIKLCHGTYVEWDGMVRHSTSLTRVGGNGTNSVYGWFVGNNHRSLASLEAAARKLR